MKKILAVFIALLLGMFTQINAQSVVTGKWKTIDDKTGKAKVCS